MTSLQTCTKCLIEKDIEEFVVRSKSKNGRRQQCKTCVNNKRAINRLGNIEEARLKEKSYYDKNKKVICYTKRLYNNLTHRQLFNKNYKLNNKDKLKIIGRNHYLNNKSMYYEKTGTRRAKKLQATVSWANSDLIKLIYSSSRYRTSLGEETYEVHHIVPLTSNIVCGLHCEINLAIIPKTLNREIGNRFWPDMP